MASSAKRARARSRLRDCRERSAAAARSSAMAVSTSGETMVSSGCPFFTTSPGFTSRVSTRPESGLPTRLVWSSSKAIFPVAAVRFPAPVSMASANFRYWILRPEGSSWSSSAIAAGVFGRSAFSRV
jgi:hypothetical protein